MTAPPSLRAGSAAAAAARAARAEIKRGMEFSGDSLREVIGRCQDPTVPYLRRMPVQELLAAMPGIGGRRAEELIELAGVARNRRLGGLGPHQVEALASLIDERAARRAARTANRS